MASILLLILAVGSAAHLWHQMKVVAGVAAASAVGAGGLFLEAAFLQSWPLLNAGFITFWVCFLLTGSALLADRERLVPRWMGLVLGVGALLLPLHVTGDWRLWLTLPLGLAWVAIGHGLWSHRGPGQETTRPPEWAR